MGGFLQLPVFPGAKFCWKEVFAASGEVRYPPDFSVFDGAVLLARKLNPFREKFGVPFRVTSWYRDPESNRRAGGVPNSLHLRGEALDFFPDSRFAEIAAFLDSHWEGGLGIYSGFMHVDLGPKRRWNG